MAGSPAKPNDGNESKAATNPDTATSEQPTKDAAAPAETGTTAAAVEPAPPKANDTGGSGQLEASNHPETSQRGDAGKTASATPADSDALIALIMAGPEIKSVSDLANKSVAIDGTQVASSERIRTAIAAAGGLEVQMSESQTKAIDRLVNGEVPAAVLTLLSPEAAKSFPENEMAGFSVFRIPLSPAAAKPD